MVGRIGLFWIMQCCIAQASGWQAVDPRLRFEPNVGQTASEVTFLARGPGYTLSLAAGQATLRAGGSVLRMKLIGANNTADAAGEKALPTRVHYMIGQDPAKWHTNVPTYAQVEFWSVYPKIDLVYYGTQGELEYDFILRPGANPAQIRLEFEGVKDVQVSGNGDLILRSAEGEFRHRSPEAYQLRNGVRKKVAGHYSLRGRDEVAFELGDYDHSSELVIDPVLLYGSYLGGTGNDVATSIAVDSGGSAYIAGWTESVDLVSGATPKLGGGGGVDVFVAKLNPSGNSIVYITYLGGRGDDRGNGIAVDASGCAVVAGSTSSADFPTTYPLQKPLLGSRNAFVARLNPAGSGLIFSTYLGGSNSDSANGVALDGQGDVYLAGETTSRNFPTLNALQGASGGGQDAFVAKFSSIGVLLYSTYLGGNADDRATAVAVDVSGNAYITGGTLSSNFPVANPFQRQLSAGQDAFVTKLSPTGVLLYSTYVGGNAGTTSFPEIGTAIAVDLAGCAYVAGLTSSTDFPTVNPFQSSLAGSQDAFVFKLNAAGNALVYASYLGGYSVNQATGIAIDASGSAYIAGYTASMEFPLANPLQSRNMGGYDAFVTEVNPLGNTLRFSTYIGGLDTDAANGIALDTANNIYLVGQTQSTDFPTAGAIQANKAGVMNGFVAKISSSSPSVVSGTPTTSTTTPQTFTFTGRDPDGYADIHRMYFLVNTSASIPVNTCHGFYDRATNGLYLYNDALTALAGPLTPGSAGTLQNSQCVVYGSSSALVSAAGTDVTINLGLGLQPGYAATPQRVYLWVQDNEGHDTGWVQTSIWSVGNTNQPPLVVSGTPTTSTTTPQTFTFTGRDPDGYADIHRMYFLVNTSASIPVNTCHGFYDRATNGLYLYNDALTALAGPLTPGSAGTLQNSQCVVSGSLSALVSAAGTDVTINLGLGLQPGYAATPQKVYLWVQDNEGHDTGWVQTSIWSVGNRNQPPVVVSGTPTTSTTTPQTFTFTGRDPDGYADIHRMYFLVNTSASIPVNTCHGFYDRATNGLYLYNDALTALAGPLTPGSAGTLQNSQCVVYGSSSALVSAAGTDVTINLGLGLQPGYAATPQKVYLWVQDNEGHDTGWVQTGTWF